MDEVIVGRPSAEGSPSITTLAAAERELVEDDPPPSSVTRIIRLTAHAPLK